ncbi:MAG: sulfatase-like hydrolase/transferase, partial [Myxococcota bacterium]
DTLAESLRDAGYLTVAFTAGGIMSKANGLARGFQWWTQRTRANLSSMLPGVFDAIGILDTTLRPIFFVLHTYDVHGPYGYLPNIERHRTALERPLRPRLPARTFGTEPKTEATAKMEWERIRRIGYHAYQRLERFGSLTDVDDAYDAGVRFVDAQLAVFFQRLRELGVYDDALIIVTSDHGESLYERGLYLGHSYTLYNEELAIPLLVKLPGSKQRGRRNELVDHTDLMPLVLEVADVGVPKDLAGSNPLSRPTGARAYVRGEASHTGASFVLGRRWKWIGEAFAKVDPRSALPEALWDRFQRERTLFDLSVGERETRVNTLVPPVEEVRGLERVLDSLARPGTGKLDASGLSSEEKRQLKELGYLQ